MLLRVLYVSAIAEGVSRSDIERLTASARRRNRQLDLTGALLVCDGHFVQALEGRESAVGEVMRKISMDHRHHRLEIRDRSLITRRLFADWDMALVDDMRCLAGVRDLIAQRSSVDDFLAAMAAWVDERRTAPS